MICQVTPCSTFLHDFLSNYQVHTNTTHTNLVKALAWYQGMLEHSLSRLFVPWNIRSRKFRPRDRSFPRTNKPCRPFPPQTIRFLDRSFPGTFVPGTLDLSCCGSFVHLSHVSFDVSDVSFDHSGGAVDEPDIDADSDLVLDDDDVLPEQPVTYHLVDWCLRHVCAGTSGRPISACKGGWRHAAGQLITSALLRKCSRIYAVV